MTTDNPVLVVLVVFFFVLLPIVQGLRGAKRGYDKVVEQQKGQTGAQRVAAIEAAMEARGFKPPPALQAAIDAFETASQPAGAPPAAMQQRPPAQQQHQRHPAQQRPPQPPAAPIRRAAPAARSLDVPAPVSPPGSARRTLADAFGDPPHARNAVILAEILGPPVALR